MANEYEIVGECPKCGAPIMMLADTLENGEREDDLAYECKYLPGVTYTCRCYRFSQANQWGYYIPSCREGSNDTPKLPYETIITWAPEYGEIYNKSNDIT